MCRVFLAGLCRRWGRGLCWTLWSHTSNDNIKKWLRHVCKCLTFFQARWTVKHLRAVGLCHLMSLRNDQSCNQGISKIEPSHKIYVFSLWIRGLIACLVVSVWIPKAVWLPEGSWPPASFSFFFSFLPIPSFSWWQIRLTSERASERAIICHK